MEPTQTGAREAEPTADSAGSAGRPGLEPPRVDPPIRRRKRKKGPCPEASAAKAKATSAEAAAEAPLPPPTVEEAAAKAPAPPPPALALLPPEVPMLGVDAEEVPPQEESEDETQITGVRTVGSTAWTIPSGVPLTVRREVESWTMETATMPTTPSFFQRCRPGPSQDCGRVPQDRGGGEAPDRAESQIPAEVATGEGETGRAKEGESQVSAEVAAGEGETGRVKEGESTRHGEEDQSSSRSYSGEGRGPGASSKESAGSFQAQRCLVGGESAPGACSGGWPSSSPSGLGSAHGDRRAGRVVGSLAPAAGTNSARGGANNYAASEEATDSLGSQGASQGRSGSRPSAAPPAPVAAPLKPAPAVPKPTQAWQYNIPEPPPVPRSSRSDSRDP